MRASRNLRRIPLKSSKRRLMKKKKKKKRKNKYQQMFHILRDNKECLTSGTKQ
jgi:hypothetical protein